MTKAKPSFFSKMLSAYAANRERQAREYVAYYVDHLHDGHPAKEQYKGVKRSPSVFL